MNHKNNMTQDERLLSEKLYQLAYQYEQKHHYCSQCTVAALQKVLQITSESLFKGSYMFAGGLVNTCQGTCGALAGGAMIISYLFGRNSREFYEDTSNKKANYLTKKLYDKFVKEYGGCLCKDVHKKIFGRSFDFWVEEDKKIFEKLGGHVDKCPDVVGKTAQWAFEIIQEEINKDKEKANKYDYK